MAFGRDLAATEWRINFQFVRLQLPKNCDRINAEIKPTERKDSAMYSKHVVVKSDVGLYARAATLFVAKANTFKSAVFVAKGDRKVNGKSLLGLLAIAVGRGEEIDISAEGADQEVAVNALCELIESNFAE